jgi:hypothetical protein
MQDVDLPNGWTEKLLALGPNPAYILASLANDGKISASQIKEARMGQPSISYAKWSELAPYFDLPIDLTMARLDIFSIVLFFSPCLFMRLSPKRHGAQEVPTGRC